SLPLNLPAATKAGPAPMIYVDISLNVLGGTLGGAVLREPNGTLHDLFAISTGDLSTGALYYETQEITARGTEFIDIILYAGNDAATPLPIGEWSIDLVGDAQKPVTVDAYVSDDKSGFYLGAAWDKAIATNASTIGIPSVADHCIAVGAHP